MKKVLFRIIIQMMILAVWMIMCYPVCAKADVFGYCLYWIMVGCPYGIRKMSMFLVPKNFDIAGSIGILALDCIIGGLIGGMIVIIRIINTAMERNNIFATIRRYVKKLEPQYNGDVYLETVRCYFDISQENLEKCRYIYQENETYAFLMSDKYIRALYTHCLVARKEAAMQGM